MKQDMLALPESVIIYQCQNTAFAGIDTWHELISLMRSDGRKYT